MTRVEDITGEQLRQLGDNVRVRQTRIPARLGNQRTFDAWRLVTEDDWAGVACVDCGLPIEIVGEKRHRVDWLICKRGYVAQVQCVECKANAKVAGIADEQARTSSLRTMLAEHGAAVLQGLGVPPEFREARLDHCPDIPAELIERVRAWCKRPAGTLYMTGAAGSGKTFVAVAALYSLLYRGWVRAADVHYTSERAYLDSVRQSYSGDKRERKGALESKAMTAPLLVYDDLASGYLSDWGHGQIPDLLNERYDRQLPNIITSNLDLSRLGRVIDSRITSRIARERFVLGFPNRDLRIEGSLK